MASGLPVVATTVGGIPSVVDQGVQGWLVAPGDHEGLGRALVSLAGSEAVRRAMGRSGFERVRRLFDIKIVADRMISHLNVLARLPSNSAVALQSVADTRAG
jgi:glycosyltransferase involved in cell wall biosynthesis